MAGVTGYDYAQDPLGKDQAGPATPAASPLTGYDYGTDPMSQQASGGQMTDTLQYPEHETVEGEMGFVDSMKEMWTGNKRREHDDWGEVPVNVRLGEQTIPIQDHMAFARDNNLARAQIFKQHLPDADIDFDVNLNPYTTYFGEPMYLNRPGASMGDISEAINTIPMEFAAARWGAGVGKVAGATGQLLGAGSALFSASVGQDKIAEVLGSDEPVDYKRARMMGLFGAGGEAAGMLLGRFFNKIMSSRRYVKSDGEFTRRGKRVLKENGIDPDSVTKEFREAFSELIDDAIAPAQAVATAEAQTLPKRVPLSRANTTRSPRDWALEERGARGAMGETAEREMGAFRQTQQDALNANRDTIQAGIGQTDNLAPSVEYSGQGMGRAQQQMRATRMALHKRMKTAYQQADELGMRVNVEGIRVVREHIMDALRGFPRANNPVRDELLDMNRIVQTSKNMGPRIKEVSIREMEDLRKRLTSLTQSTDPTTAQAARVAVRALDDGMEAAIEQGAYTGNVQALRAYQKGRNTRALIGRMFEDNKIVRSIMEAEAGPYSALKVTPEEAANKIFTGSALGFKPGAEKALIQIKKNLLAAGNEPAWNAIREEAVWRLMRSTQGADILQDGAYAFSGKKFATAMDKTMREHRGLMNVLFSKQEQGLLRQLRNTAVNVTVPPPGAVNYSNTSYEIMRNLEMLFGPGARILSNVARSFGRNYEEVSARTAVNQATRGGRGYAPLPRKMPPGTVGGFSGLGAAEGQRRQQTLSNTQRRRLQR